MISAPRLCLRPVVQTSPHRLIVFDEVLLPLLKLRFVSFRSDLLAFSCAYSHTLFTFLELTFTTKYLLDRVQRDLTIQLLCTPANTLQLHAQRHVFDFAVLLRNIYALP